MNEVSETSKIRTCLQKWEWVLQKSSHFSACRTDVTHFLHCTVKYRQTVLHPPASLLSFSNSCAGVTIGQTSSPPSLSVPGLLSDKPPFFPHYLCWVYFRTNPASSSCFHPSLPHPSHSHRHTCSLRLVLGVAQWWISVGSAHLEKDQPKRNPHMIHLRITNTTVDSVRVYCWSNGKWGSWQFSKVFLLMRKERQCSL